MVQPFSLAAGGPAYGPKDTEAPCHARDVPLGHHVLQVPWECMSEAAPSWGIGASWGLEGIWEADKGHSSILGQSVQGELEPAGKCQVALRRPAKALSLSLCLEPAAQSWEQGLQ